ncbi:hypothetical protein [Kitasatospora sp. NBC_01300]|uniref:hypothetical protein n=1 Tax=Kitasatospora sp. NBC_01300 TaxID=2903574 RepID=UPI00352CA16E|nr:hypothetical protein OG556_07525 [Kitasatospora sp. NBC_01300]
MSTASNSTTSTTGTTLRGLRLALRAYPAAYRAERSEEIIAVHADSTAGAGRLAAIRETVGVAAYGLRVRTGITASSTAGRLLATTAPLAAAMALGQQLTALVFLPDKWREATASQSSALQHPGTAFVDWHSPLIAQTVTQVLWLLVVVALLFRRWTTVRALAALAGVAAIAQCFVQQREIWIAVPGFPPDYTLLIMSSGANVLWSLLVFAAPGDLLESTIARRPRAVVPPALVLVASLLVSNLGRLSALLYDNSLPVLPQPVLTAMGVCIPLALLSLASLRWGRLLPAATALAVLPPVLSLSLGLNAFFRWYDNELGDLGLLCQYLLTVTLIALVTAAAVRYLKPAPAAPSRLGAA